MTKIININKIETNTGQVPGLPKNPRFCKDDRFNKLVASIESLPEMMELREVIVYPFGKKFVAIAGNMRLRGCKQLGWKEVPCKVLDASTPIEKLKEIAIKDNVAFGENDLELLQLEWNINILSGWGMDLDISNSIGGNIIDSQKYTQKIQTPIYEAKNEKPLFEDIYDKARFNEIIKKIEGSAVSDEDKQFLKVAATRHIVFNYEKIADLYANSTKDVQELMEDSALVIIDFNKAIELGYVKLSDEIANQYAEDYGNDE